MELGQAIEGLELNNGRYAKEAVHTILEAGSEAIPQLLELISNSPENIAKIKANPAHFAHIYSLFILSQMREKSAFPAVMGLLQQPEDVVDELFGDAITEGGAKWIASTYNGDFDLLANFVEDKGTDIYARTQGILAMAILVLWDELDRDVVVEYCRKLLTQEKNGVLLADTAYVAGVLGMGELKDELKAIFAQGKIDKGALQFNEILPALSCDPKLPMEANKEEAHCRCVEDIDAELGEWPCFELDYKERHNMITVVNEVKIGRNDPCTCGSGKKYKKCCGK